MQTGQEYLPLQHDTHPVPITPQNKFTRKKRKRPTYSPRKLRTLYKKRNTQLQPNLTLWDTVPSSPADTQPHCSNNDVIDIIFDSVYDEIVDMMDDSGLDEMEDDVHEVVDIIDGLIVDGVTEDMMDESYFHYQYSLVKGQYNKLANLR